MAQNTRMALSRRQFLDRVLQRTRPIENVQFQEPMQRGRTVKMNRTLRGGAVAALATAAVILTACSGGGGEQGDGGDRVYVQAIGDDPMSLNAQFSGGLTPSMFSSQVFDPLIFLSPTQELSPALAESWELSEDGLDLSLAIRQGVTWHDGEPFTAEDVAFNVEEIFELSSYGAEITDRLDSVEVVDDSTVVVHMREPYGPLLETVASQYILPKHVYEDTDYVTNEANMAPVGTGPMAFESYSSGEEVTLVKNDDYWGGEVQVDSAVYPIMSDPNTRAEALFAGEIDQASIDISQQERAAETPNMVLLENITFPQVVQVVFNTESEHLTDPDVRKAVFSAIDRQAIVDAPLAGLGVPADGFFPESLEWAMSPDVDFARDYPHDVEAINQKLDALGLERGSGGTRFTLRIRYIAEVSDNAATAEYMKSLFHEVGIGVELLGTSGAIYLEKTREGDYDISIGRTSIGADPSIGMVRWYVCNEEGIPGLNSSGACDETIDQAAEDAVSTSRQEERAQAFITLQNRANELLFYAPIAWTNAAVPTANTSRWQGLDESPAMTNRIPWTTMSLAE